MLQTDSSQKLHTEEDRECMLPCARHQTPYIRGLTQGGICSHRTNEIIPFKMKMLTVKDDLEQHT